MCLERCRVEEVMLLPYYEPFTWLLADHVRERKPLYSICTKYTKAAQGSIEEPHRDNAASKDAPSARRLAFRGLDNARESYRRCSARQTSQTSRIGATEQQQPEGGGTRERRVRRCGRTRSSRRCKQAHPAGIAPRKRIAGNR